MTEADSYIEWSREHFRVLKDGGLWMVPGVRSIYRKEGNRLVLLAEQPSASRRADQRRLYGLIERYFGLAGIEVIRSDPLHDWVETVLEVERRKPVIR